MKGRTFSLPFMVLFLCANYAFSQDLEWIIEPEDFLPPGDITMQYSDVNCTDQFDNCMWTGVLEGENMIQSWPWEVIPGVHFSFQVDRLYDITYSFLPCDEAIDVVEADNFATGGELVPVQNNSSTTSTVCINILDGNQQDELEYCFNATIECLGCSSTGNIRCGTCEAVDLPLGDEGCKFCDPTALANGLVGCTPPCDDPSCPPMSGGSQPAILCDMAGALVENISWFSFVPNKEDLTVEVLVFNCVGAGVQSGIYSSCAFDEPCVGFNVSCSSNGNIEYDANFEIGQTYYLFIDGCNGSECEYEVTIDGLEELLPDDIDHLTAYSICENASLTETIPTGGTNASISGICTAANRVVVCLGEVIQFGVRHQGNQGHFPSNEDPCDEYPLLDASFQWSTSWGVNVDYNPYEENTGQFIEELAVPSIAGVYNVCLDFIDYECFPVLGPVCLEIEVQSDQLRTYFLDEDGDGFGGDIQENLPCPAPFGYVCKSGDCDDTNSAINPLTQPPSPNLQCESTGPFSVIYTWDVLPSFEYFIDLSLIQATAQNLDPTPIGNNQIEFTGFIDPCQFALLTIDVIADLPAPCNKFSQTIPCRPSIRPQIVFQNSVDGLTTFKECEQHEIQDLVAIVDGVENPINGEWQYQLTGTPNPLGFTLSGPTATFNPNGLPLGIYTINYHYTNATDGCVEIIQLTFLIEACNVMVDADGDGVVTDEDCNDNDPTVFPGNPEICDGKDNNCDGQIDEGVILEDPNVVCSRAEIDFVEFDWNEVAGATAYNLVIEDPSNGRQEINNYTETTIVVVGLNAADEVTICVSPIAPGACSVESCVSCVASSCTLFPQLSFNPCIEEPGSITFSWNAIPGINNYFVSDPSTTVTVVSTMFTVSGLDEGESVTIQVTPIHPTPGCVLPGIQITCTAPFMFIDNDGDGSPAGEDCDDNDPNVFPGNLEICDGKDNNCDGIIDGSFRICNDGDNCTVDDIESVLPDGTICIPCNGTGLNCNTGSTTTRVCDDGNPNTVDDIETILDCDASICKPCQGVPADCSTGTVMQQACDDGNACTDNDMVSVLLDGTICVPCQGMPIDCNTGSTLVQSCDDGDPTTINDVETVLGCDGTICIPCMGTILVDNDGDGFSPPEDCDDNDSNIFPGNQELCDNRDNNCNGEIDEGLDFMTYFVDNDRDGFGDDATAFEACLPPPDVTTRGGDCDDFNNTIFPGATEIPNNGVDEDCDGADATTATHNLAGQQIEVYPNPVADVLYIDTDIQNMRFAIYSLDAQLVTGGQLQSAQIVTESLSSGTYFLILENEEGDRVVDRIVKM